MFSIAVASASREMQRLSLAREREALLWKIAASVVGQERKASPPAHLALLKVIVDEKDKGVLDQTFRLAVADRDDYTRHQIEDALLEALTRRLQKQWKACFDAALERNIHRFSDVVDTSEAEAFCELAHAAYEEEKVARSLDMQPLTYGEINFESFASIFMHHLPDLPRDGVFVDLGSGVARAVIAASLLHDFKTLVGIEFLASLHELGVHACQAFASAASDAVSAGSSTASAAAAATESKEDKTAGTAARAKEAKSDAKQAGKAEAAASASGTAAAGASGADSKSGSQEYKVSVPDKVEFESKGITLIRGDFLHHDWSDADLVFANSTWYVPDPLASLVNTHAFFLCRHVLCV